MKQEDLENDVAYYEGEKLWHGYDFYNISKHISPGNMRNISN